MLSSCKFNGVRSFYCLSEDKCITIWKTESNSAFIILGKYNSAKTPSDDYIKLIDITNAVDWYASVIFTKDDKLLIDVVDDNTKVISQSSKGTIELYNNNKTLNDSLYTYFDGKYRRYKNDVEYISIDIKQNYATDKSGKKLK
tara:strand:- start:395 stop:823 length:429 start_codon:yes stop_codon:yes gene_type:complete